MTAHVAPGCVLIATGYFGMGDGSLAHRMYRQAILDGQQASITETSEGWEVRCYLPTPQSFADASRRARLQAWRRRES